MPGPGQYEVLASPKRANLSTGFGTEKRAVGAGSSKVTLDVPGPGQYTIDRGLGVGAPVTGFGTSQRSQTGGGKS